MMMTIRDQRVMEAARIVGADKFIADLPQKYNEEVKERGATLSVGQKQLISFARASGLQSQNSDT